MTQPAENHAKPSSKPSIVSLIVAALVGGGAAFVLTQLQFRLWIESPSDTEPPILSTRPTTAPATPTTSPTTSPSPRAVAPSPPSPVQALKNGLRVSNQSDYALRVVLLSQSPAMSNEAQTNGAQTNGAQTNGAQTNSALKRDRKPAHWDFAPSEGSQEGLLLSLPSGKLTLERGDILVAFALDGSRRYWGPYVVGETTVPVQSPATDEWQMILRP